MQLPGPTAALSLLLVLGGGVARAQTSLAPPRWDADVRLTEIADTNSAPNVVEVALSAKLAEVRIAGTTVKAWTYNGSVPGPLIRTKVGDRLIVHFTNELAEPTTVHWHGVRVPIAMTVCRGSRSPRSRAVSPSPTTSWSRMRASTGITRT